MNKLDRWLTDFCEAFGIILEWIIIVLLPVVVIEQICIWLANNAAHWLF